MVKIFLCIGIAVVYILTLIVATMIAVKLWGNVDPDDIDYSMTANVIQFFMMLLIIAGKVGKWII